MKALLTALAILLLAYNPMRAQLPGVEMNFYTSGTAGKTDVFNVGETMRCDVEFHHSDDFTPNPGDVIFLDGTGNPLELTAKDRIFINNPFHNAWLGTLTYWVTFPADFTTSSTEVRMKIPFEYNGETIVAEKVVTVVKELDYTPLLLSPENGATEISLRNYGQATIKWQAVTNVTQYHVQVATSSTFESGSILKETDQLSPSPAPQWVPSELASNTTYFWRVRSYAPDKKWSAWSKVWEFSTQEGGVPSYPEDGATDMEIPVTLSWESFQNSASYRVQISTTPKFTTQEKGPAITSTILVDENVSDTTYTASALEPNTTYYWRVASGINSTFAGFSTTRSFTTAGVSGVQEKSRNDLHLFMHDNALIINGPVGRNSTLYLYDLNGRLLSTTVLPESLNGANSIQITSVPSAGPMLYELRHNDDIRRGRFR